MLYEGLLIECSHKVKLAKEHEARSKELREFDVAVMSIWPGLVIGENRLVHAERQPDGRMTLFGLDLSHSETPAFPGRGVVALATDKDRMRRTGGSFWGAELAHDYGFTDVDGSIPDARKLHAQLKESAPDYWKDVVGD